MLEGLIWQGLKGRTPYAEYTGPTWSWASYDGIAGVASFQGWADVAEVRGWHAEPKDKSSPLGEVEPGAWVKLHGPMTELKLSAEKETEYEIRLRRADLAPPPRFCTIYSEEDTGTLVTLDYYEGRTAEDLQDWDLQVIILAGRKIEESERAKEEVNDTDDKDRSTRPLDTFHGLVIRRFHQGGVERLERLGCMWFDRTEGYAILEDKQNWRTISIV